MFRKIVSGLLILIFIPLILTEVFLFNLWNTALRSGLYKKNLEKHKIYDLVYDYALPEFVADIIKKEKDKEVFDDLPIPKEKLANLLTEIFPKSFLKETVEKALDNLFPYLRGETETLKIEVSLVEVKVEFIPRLESFMIAEVNDLPSCSQEQLEKFEEPLDRFPECFPSGFDRAAFVNELKGPLVQDFKGEIGNIPDTIDLVETLGGNKTLSQIRQTISSLPLIMGIILFFLLFILISIVLLLAYAKDSAMRGLGIALFLPSLIWLFSAVNSQIILFDFIEENLAKTMTDIPLVVRQSIGEFIKSLSAEILAPMIYQSSIIIAIGLLLILSSFLVKKWPLKNQPER